MEILHNDPGSIERLHNKSFHQFLLFPYWLAEMLEVYESQFLNYNSLAVHHVSSYRTIELQELQ